MRKIGRGVHDSCLKCTLPGANGTGVECRMERKGGEAGYRMVKAKSCRRCNAEARRSRIEDVSNVPVMTVWATMYVLLVCSDLVPVL